ncbi:MAG: glyoxylate/hydroxypyruvate reductase A [Pseudomonadota bacterium]
MTGVLFAAKSDRWEDYEASLRAAFSEAGVEVDLSTDLAPERVEYLVYAPDSDVRDFGTFPNLKAVLNLWAGVEGVVGNETLRVPLCRMVEPGLREGMVEYVTGHVLRHHLMIDRFLARQDRWDYAIPPLARDRTVGILGLGELGAACAEALAGLKFRVLGWSRSEKDLGVETFSGDQGLRAVLTASDILVLLLPLTRATENVLAAETIALMPEGAVVINPGRGPLVDDDALLAALDSGHLSHATLDVFREEPLPEGHPFWAHPKVTVTPHVASATRAGTAAKVIAENVRRGEAGEPLLYQVDRGAGY